MIPRRPKVSAMNPQKNAVEIMPVANNYQYRCNYEAASKCISYLHKIRNWVSLYRTWWDEGRIPPMVRRRTSTRMKIYLRNLQVKSRATKDNWIFHILKSFTTVCFKLFLQATLYSRKGTNHNFSISQETQKTSNQVEAVYFQQ